MNKKITLSVKDLELWFDNDYGAVKILNKISFDIYKGETLGIVGESGCGKSMTSLCIMQLLDPTRAHVMGSIRFQGRDLLKLNDRKMQQVRGKQTRDERRRDHARKTRGFFILQDGNGAPGQAKQQKRRGISGPCSPNGVAEMRAGVGEQQRVRHADARRKDETAHACFQQLFTHAVHSFKRSS